MMRFGKSRRHNGERPAAQVAAGNLSHRPTRPAGQTEATNKSLGPPGPAGQKGKPLLVPDPTRVAQHQQARIPNRHDSSTEEFGACHADVTSTPHESMRYRDRCAVRIYSPVAGFGSASEGSLPRLDWSGRGCFLLKINSARENSATNMRQHFRICCGRAGRLPLSAPSLRGSDESYAGGSRANCGATPPGSAGRRYRPTMRAFRANCEKST